LRARVAAGDGPAFDDLYARYAHLAAVLALSILHEPALVEDAVQEAFLAVWRRAPTYDPARGSVRSWLLTIVRHRAIDDHRCKIPEFLRAIPQFLRHKSHSSCAILHRPP